MTLTISYRKFIELVSPYLSRHIEITKVSSEGLNTLLLKFSSTKFPLLGTKCRIKFSINASSKLKVNIIEYPGVPKWLSSKIMGIFDVDKKLPLGINYDIVNHLIEVDSLVLLEGKLNPAIDQVKLNSDHLLLKFSLL